MKKRIFCLLSKEASLQPISGDRINEINLMKSLSVNYDVFYNGVFFDGKSNFHGRSDGKIHIPTRGEFDLVYIRNNPEVFLKSPHPKIWFASPYDKQCFEDADAIACMTRPWRDRLQSYSHCDYEYFDRSYPADMPSPKKCILFPQAIELKTEMSIPKPNLFQTIKRIILDNPNKKFTLKHFGPIRESNYPHHLVDFLKRDKHAASKVQAIAIGAGKKVKLDNIIRKVSRIPADRVNCELVSSDAIWYHQHRSGNIAGSLKVLEAMAAGVPVLLPRWDARVDELGADYPFFWTPIEAGSFEQKQPDFDKIINKLISSSLDERRKISNDLKKKAEKFSIQNVAEIVHAELSSIIGSHK